MLSIGSMKGRTTGKIAKLAVTALAFTALWAMTVLADQTVDTSRFVPGTKVNGVGIGGLTVEEAREQIEGFYAGEYTFTIKERGGVTETVRGTDIAYSVGILPEGLKAVLDAQNASGRNSGPDADNGHTMAVSVTFSREALLEKIAGLSLISGSGIVTTRDAAISPYEEGKPYTIIPAVQGNNVDVEKTTALILEAVNGGQTSFDADGAGCYIQVNVWEGDPALNALCNTMNQYRQMTVSYNFGETKETVTGETICSWINGTVDGTVQVNADAVTAFVTDLAARYDTAGTARTFLTAAGTEVELTGAYGWKIDVAGEAAALTALIQAGPAKEPVEREPVYSSAAVSRTAPDWGSTYVEVDLAGQHVYMFQEGTLVWEAPCVTGNVSKNYTTPAGIYSLAYKERDKVLRGKKLADGSYEYESPVSYWMPFNGGIGLHDANWRGTFGGTIYQTGGSHGCVNLPPSSVPALYELVYKGIPVICHGA